MYTMVNNVAISNIISIIKVGYLLEYRDVTPQAVKQEIEHVEEKPLRFLIKKEKPPPRPVTPTVDEPPEVSLCLIQADNSYLAAKMFGILSPFLFRVKRRKNMQSSSYRSSWEDGESRRRSDPVYMQKRALRQQELIWCGCLCRC